MHARDERYVVQEYFWGKDPFMMDVQTSRHAEFGDALSEAERSWETGKGHSSKISILDALPLDLKQMPRVLWWRHCAGPDPWVPLIEQDGDRLLVPEKPGDGFAYVLSQNKFRVVSSDSLLESLGSGNIADGANVRDLLETIWEVIWKVHRLVELPLTGYFEGLEAKKDHVDVFIESIEPRQGGL